MADDEEIVIQHLPIATPTERDWLLIQSGWSPVRYMTREEAEEKFPGSTKKLK